MSADKELRPADEIKDVGDMAAHAARVKLKREAFEKAQAEKMAKIRPTQLRHPKPVDGGAK